MRRFLVFVALLATVTILAGNMAFAGPLAPKPRVIVELDRQSLLRAGVQTLGEFLDTGIARYVLTGGPSVLVMINGRPYATTSGSLESLPISAIERIEVLGGDSLGTLDGGAVRGALNIVLRNELDGFETRALARAPDQTGGDGWQGSVTWGGDVGKGRVTIGADVLDRREIAARHRDYSRSKWTESGSFNEGQNISVGGNTVWVVQLNDEGAFTGIRSVSLGECDPERGYTGPLANPPGISNGDKGCGFAYGKFMWNTDSLEQTSATLSLDHPLGDSSDLHVEARIVQGQSAFRYAPAVGTFSLRPDANLLQAINEAAGSDFQADANDLISVAHRFVALGNRDWQTDSEEYDLAISVEGPLTDSLGYDARISATRVDNFRTGENFVHAGRIREEIEAGNYDLVNPFSTAPQHVQAMRNAILREEIEAGGEYLEARLALEGSGFTIGKQDAAWAAGVQASTLDQHQIMVFHDDDGTAYPVSEVLGSGGISYAGDRNAVGAFAEMSLPVLDNMALRVGGRTDEYDDIGRLNSWRLSVEMRPIDLVTLRSSWSAGDRSPPMWRLYSSDVQDHPYVDCDPGSGPPPRTCTGSNPRQVSRVTTGNPQLDPSFSERISVGGVASRGPFSFGLEWYRLSSSGEAGQNSADWAMQNMPECGGVHGTNCIDRSGGDITIRDSYANVVDSETSGVNVRFGGGFRTSWGAVGLRGVLRRVTDAELRIAGEERRLPIARKIATVGFLAQRGGLTAVYTANYRSGYENLAGVGRFDSWTGHDLELDWANPLGLVGARVTAGILNLTDAGLAVDTSNPSSVDGPTEASWGRTLFLSFSQKF